MSEKKEFIATRKGIKYLDLFAGAGGFSEGFMQDLRNCRDIAKELYANLQKIEKAIKPR